METIINKNVQFLPNNTRGLQIRLYNGDETTMRGCLINRSLIVCSFLTSIAINQAMKLYSMITASSTAEGRKTYNINHDYFKFESKKWTKKLYDAKSAYEKDFHRNIPMEEQMFISDCFDFGDAETNLLMLKIYNSIFIEIGKAGFEDQKIIANISLLLYMVAFSKTLFDNVRDAYAEVETQMKWMENDINMIFHASFSFCRSIKKYKRDGSIYNGTLFEITNTDMVNLGMEAFRTMLYDDNFYRRMFLAGDGKLEEEEKTENIEENVKPEFSLSDALSKLQEKGWKVS